jgi:hypothetical protein
MAQPQNGKCTQARKQNDSTVILHCGDGKQDKSIFVFKPSISPDKKLGIAERRYDYPPCGKQATSPTLLCTTCGLLPKEK